MNKYKCPLCEAERTQIHLWVKDWFLTREQFEIHECLKCGLLFTEPRPSTEELGRYYQSEEYYSHQENKNGFIPKLYETIKKINIRHKAKIATAGKRVGNMLEIGCGVGDFIHEMERRKWTCTGIEPSEDAKAIARNKVKAQLLNPDEIASLPDESFDLIAMWHVLEHVENLNEELNHLHRLLKKGGRIVIAVPNYKSDDAEYYKEFWAAYDVPRHLNHFSRETIKSIFKSNGLYLKETDKLVWDAYYISYLSEKYQRHKLSLLKGAIRGLASNIKARSTKEWSSPIYVFIR